MRIIAGELKGRRLSSPKWEGLRPTSDKLRETLFNVVAQRVPEARVLDLYAGTGAIGIEALSRGAVHVTFVDKDVRARKLIEENLPRCGVSDRYVIIRTPQSLPAESFDLVVLDPPYAEPDLSSNDCRGRTSRCPRWFTDTGTRASPAGPAPDGRVQDRLRRERRGLDPSRSDSALAFSFTS